MRKRDRTDEEKVADRLIRQGMMLLGVDPAVKPRPLPFPYLLFRGKSDRRGQKCKVVESNRSNALVEFEDGFRTRVSRQAIKRAKV